jgi:peptidyl-prolyl cis-trans isomerase C
MFSKRMFLLALFGAAVACNTGVPESEIVAKVNGEPITKTEFEAQVERNLARYRGQNHQLPPSIEQRIKESVLRRMIDDAMIAQRAKEIGADVTEADLQAKFQEYKGRFRTDQAFQDYLKRSKNTEENMKADLKRNMLRDRVVEKLSGEVDVTDEDTAKYYEENKVRFVEKEQIKASRILVRVAPNAPAAEKTKAKAKAREALKKVKAPGADFAELAKEYSNGPQAARGGDLGWFARGRMLPEFENVAFGMEAGAVSDVLETKMGFEIIKVWDKKPERQRPLEEVSANIKNSLLARKRNEKRREILRTLKADAKIEQLIKFEAPPPGRAPTAAPGAPGQPGMPGAPGHLGAKPPRMPRPMRDLKPGAPPPETATPKAPAPQPEGTTPQ